MSIRSEKIETLIAEIDEEINKWSYQGDGLEVRVHLFKMKLFRFIVTKWFKFKPI